MLMISIGIDPNWWSQSWLYESPGKLFKNIQPRSSRRGAVETNLTRNHEEADLIPGPSQWVNDLALP